MLTRVVLSFFLVTVGMSVRAEDTVPANRFVFTQLKYEGDWDPYPTIWPAIASYLQNTTSLTPWPERRVVSLNDPLLFESPYLVWMGRGPVPFTEQEAVVLRRYLQAGGLLIVDDSDADKNGPFRRSVRRILSQVLPDSTWEALPPDHPILRSFFLLRTVAGRRQTESNLSILRIQSRTAVVFCGNDLHGAWYRDYMGRYLLGCEPGGDVQRNESFKMTLNLIMFGLTGTYKTDAIHQPFLERKMNR